MRLLTWLPFPKLSLPYAGASFVGTFFVIPRFKDSFKEDLEWRDIYSALSSAGVKQLQPKEVYAKCKRYGFCITAGLQRRVSGCVGCVIGLYRAQQCRCVAVAVEGCVRKSQEVWQHKTAGGTMVMVVF
jgi:hypothetical protein